MAYEAYVSANSIEANTGLVGHYAEGANMYKALADFGTMWKALLIGWGRSGHPAQIHYGWDVEDHGMDEGIRKSVAVTAEWLGLPSERCLRILEGGCGVGGSAVQLAGEFDCRVVGVSVVREQLEIAESIRRARAVENALFEEANLMKLPYADESFDGTFSTEVHCYIPETEKPTLYAELFRVLRPGARMVIQDGYLGRRPVGAAAAAYETLKRGWTLPDLVPPDRLTEIAEEAGFCALHVEDVTERVAAFARTVRRKALHWRPTLWVGGLLRGVPLLGLPFRLLGVCGDNALPFARAVIAQQILIETRTMPYYLHVFEKPQR